MNYIVYNIRTSIIIYDWVELSVMLSLADNAMTLNLKADCLFKGQGSLTTKRYSLSFKRLQLADKKDYVW